MGILDQVLVMSVNPGFGGQSFIEAVLPKVERIRKMADATGREIDLEIDGGINDHTITRAAKAGVNVFVAGNAVFTDPDYKAAISRLRELAK